MDSNLKIGDSILILLAAGASTRMVVNDKAVPKGLLLHQGIPWIAKQIDCFLRYYQKEDGRVIVVLGYHHQQYLGAINDFFFQRVEQRSKRPLLSFAVNLKPSLGPFSSLQTGLKQLWQTDYFSYCNLPTIFIGLLDVPLATKKTLDLMRFSRLPESGSTFPCVTIPCDLDSGRSGHPILISSKSLVEKILETATESENARLDILIKNQPAELKNKVYVNDDRILLNLNRIEDWESFVRRKNRP